MDNGNLKFGLIITGLLFFSSCAKQNNPPSAVVDPNPESTRIYGEIEGPPKQAANVYEADPAAIQKSDAIRQKLFPK